MGVLNIRAIIIKEIDNYLQSGEFKKLLKQKINSLPAEKSEHKRIKYNRISECFSIVREADTIEDLCDEFVLHYDSTLQADRPIPWATYERLGDNWDACKEMLIKEFDNKSGRNPTIYGAVWTEKGLIYIAKMNKDGTLELL